MHMRKLIVISTVIIVIVVAIFLKITSGNEPEPASPIVLLVGGVIYAVKRDSKLPYFVVVDGGMRQIFWQGTHVGNAGKTDRIIIERFTVGSLRRRRIYYHIKIGIRKQQTQILNTFLVYDNALYITDEIARILNVGLHYTEL